MFINDITFNLNVKFILYADDMKIYCPILNIADCQNLQSNLLGIKNWCSSNNLPLNISKCNVMTFSRKHNPVVFPYTLDHNIIRRPDVVKDLGVTFDCQLNFNEHINTVVAEANKNMGFIIRNTKEFHSKDALMSLYYTLVRSHLEYAFLIWYPKYGAQVSILENVQRKFLKYVSFKITGLYPPIGYPHNILLNECNVASLDLRRQTQSVITLFKIINNLIDSPDILSYLNFNIPRLSSRHPSTFNLATPNTLLLKSSPIYTMCQNYFAVQTDIDIFNTTISRIKSQMLSMV